MKKILLFNSVPAIAYATWSPTNKSSNVTLSGSNLVATGSAGVFGMCIATIGKTVASAYKGYYEFTLTNKGGISETIGLSTNVPTSSDTTTTVGRVANSFGSRWDSGNWNYSSNTGGGWVTTGAGTKPMANGDVIGFAVDMGAQTCAVYINNLLAYTWTGLNSGITWYPAMVSNASSNIITANFGASAFVYTPPAGFTAGWY